MKKPLSVNERYLSKSSVGSSHWWAKRVLSDILPNLPQGGAHILDIGPGNGGIGEFLKIRGITDLFAVESDEDTRTRLSSLYKKISPDIAAFGCMEFDVILTLDVLEHMPNPEQFFFSACKMLKPNGIFLISVPNIAHWSVRIPLLFGFFPEFNRGILDRTHLQHFTRQRFLKTLRLDSTLQIVEISSSIEPCEFILPKIIWDNRYFQGLGHARLWVANLLPGLFAYQHMAVVRRLSGVAP